MSVEASLISLVVGAAVASLFGIVAYFLKRVIDQNDRFQLETRRNFKDIRQTLSTHDRNTANLRQSLEEKIKGFGFDTTTKAKVSSLLASVSQVEKELIKIRPTLDKAGESNGKIIWIVGQLEAQDKKLTTLYKAMIKIVKPQKPAG